VQHRLDDVRAVYTRGAGETDAAIGAVQSFFEAVHQLKDWLGNAPSSTIINGNSPPSEDVMHSLGIDLAVAPPDTAACEITCTRSWT
jgi:hypothetical protein